MNQYAYYFFHDINKYKSIFYEKRIGLVNRKVDLL